MALFGGWMVSFDGRLVLSFSILPSSHGRAVFQAFFSPLQHITLISWLIGTNLEAIRLRVLPGEGGK